MRAMPSSRSRLSRSRSSLAPQIVIGTDYAVPWVKGPVDHVLATPGLSDAERIAILGGNAAKLLRLESYSMIPKSCRLFGQDHATTR